MTLPHHVVGDASASEPALPHLFLHIAIGAAWSTDTYNYDFMSIGLEYLYKRACGGEWGSSQQHLSTFSSSKHRIMSLPTRKVGNDQVTGMLDCLLA